MRALLDTHVVLWFAADDPRLSKTVRRMLEAGGHELFLSPVTPIEIGLKCLRGKLRLEIDAGAFVTQAMEMLGLLPLPITLAHGLAVSELPLYHADPFDRLLVAQGRCENLPIITADASIRRYGVKIIW